MSDRIEIPKDVGLNCHCGFAGCTKFELLIHTQEQKTTLIRALGGWPKDKVLNEFTPNGVVEDAINDLKSQLATVTKERDELAEKIGKLSKAFIPLDGCRSEIDGNEVIAVLHGGLNVQKHLVVTINPHKAVRVNPMLPSEILLPPPPRTETVNVVVFEDNKGNIDHDVTVHSKEQLIEILERREYKLLSYTTHEIELTQLERARGEG
jgi:hypothetical protein